MSDFIFNGKDYVNYINTDEDLALWERLVELGPKLLEKDPFNLLATMEAVRILDKLEGLPRRTFIILGDSEKN